MSSHPLNAHTEHEDAPVSDELPDYHQWSEKEITTLKSLWLGSLPPVPPDPSNRYADDPGAAGLGEKMFFDTRFSANGKISCGTCHIPQLKFTDALPVAVGMEATARRTMPLVGNAYFSWFFWDGRKDSLWSQALGPPEAVKEHGITRTRCAHLIEDHYKIEYETVFGTLPSFPEDICPPIARPDPSDTEAYSAWMSIPEKKQEEISRVFANMGKAIEAYVRTIVPGPSRFDLYIEKLLKGDTETMKRLFTEDEAKGLRLFIGKAKCINCHNGPLLTNSEFHHVGVSDPPGKPDRGRADGIRDVLKDEFNCLGRFSDADPKECLELRFIDTNTKKYIGAFKTPSLRNVAERPPYMHAGQFKTLREVITFYTTVRPGGTISKELEHLDLSEEEQMQLEAFLRTLSGPVIVKDSARP